MSEVATVERLQKLLAERSASLDAALARAERAEAALSLRDARIRELEGYIDRYRPQRELLQAITDRVMAGILVLDGRDLRAKWANPACRRMLDEPYCSQTDVVGLPVEQLLPGAKEIGLVEMLREVAASGQARFSPESEYGGFERGATYWRWSIVPLPNGSDTTPDILLVANELTEQVANRQRVEALAERLASDQRFLNSIMENVPATITYLDENLLYRHCNEAAAHEFGKASAHEVFGMHLLEVMPGNPQLLAAVEGVLRSGQPFRSEELPIRWPDRPEEGTQYYTVAYLPDIDASGRVRGVFASGQRVTALVEARQKLQATSDELEERVRERTAELRRTVEALRREASIVASVTDAVLVTDLHGRIVAFNHGAEEMAGWQAEEVIGRTPVDIFGRRFLNQSKEQVYAELAENGKWQGELIACRRDGTELYVDSRATQLKDSAGGVIGSIWVNRDITGRVRTEQALRASREELRNYSRRLVDAVENERRNLARELHDQAGQSLSALKLTLGQMRGASPEHSQFAERFDEVEGLIDVVMDDLHRLARNLRPVSLDRYGLAPALRQYLDFYREQSGMAVKLAATGIEEQRLPADVETALYRIVQEALTNVVRHANAKQVAVILHRREGEAVAIIEDDGQGFAVDEARHCDRLGLLGMRERAEMLGGTLTIESTPGQGTTVYIEIPVPPKVESQVQADAG